MDARSNRKTSIVRRLIAGFSKVTGKISRLISATASPTPTPPMTVFPIFSHGVAAPTAPTGPKLNESSSRTEPHCRRSHVGVIHLCVGYDASVPFDCIGHGAQQDCMENIRKKVIKESVIVYTIRTKRKRSSKIIRNNADPIIPKGRKNLGYFRVFPSRAHPPDSTLPSTNTISTHYCFEKQPFKYTDLEILPPSLLPANIGQSPATTILPSIPPRITSKTRSTIFPAGIQHSPCDSVTMEQSHTNFDEQLELIAMVDVERENLDPYIDPSLLYCGCREPSSINCAVHAEFECLQTSLTVSMQGDWSSSPEEFNNFWGNEPPFADSVISTPEETFAVVEKAEPAPGQEPSLPKNSPVTPPPCSAADTPVSAESFGSPIKTPFSAPPSSPAAQSPSSPGSSSKQHEHLDASKPARPGKRKASSLCSCGKEFKRRCDLTKHRQRYDRKFACPHENCRYHKKRWATQKDLERHISSVHTDPVRHIMCGVAGCSKTCSRQDNMRDHMKRKHFKDRLKLVETELAACMERHKERMTSLDEQLKAARVSL
ncbi:hypothetical protein RUND412_006637 [Rhizina undulata]